MTRYISTPVSVDRGSVRALIEATLVALYPGVEIEPGTLADYLVDTFAGASAEDRQLLTEQLAISMKYSGEKIDRVAQDEAIPAATTSTWTRTSADEIAVGARTVLAGTEVTLTGTDGEPRAFRTAADFTFADNVLATSAGAVGLTAVVAGTDGNGLTLNPQPAQTLTWLNTIAIIAPTAGGVDAEDDDAYLDRLSDTRPLQLQAISTGPDIARWLRNQPGVSRALGLDNQNGASSGVAGHITAVPVDSDGAALSAPAMAALAAEAQAITLTNLIVHIQAPTTTTVTVVFTGVAEPGWDAADVESRAEAAVLDFLDPARWGLPDSGDVRLWREKTTVYYDDIITVLNNVDGFDRKTSLTLNGSATDLTLSGPGALPSSSSSAVGTVTAP